MFPKANLSFNAPAKPEVSVSANQAEFDRLCVP